MRALSHFDPISPVRPIHRSAFAGRLSRQLDRCHRRAQVLTVTRACLREQTKTKQSEANDIKQNTQNNTKTTCQIHDRANTTRSPPLLQVIEVQRPSDVHNVTRANNHNEAEQNERTHTQTTQSKAKTNRKTNVEKDTTR